MYTYRYIYTQLDHLDLCDRPTIRADFETTLGIYKANIYLIYIKMSELPTWDAIWRISVVKSKQVNLILCSLTRFYWLNIIQSEIISCDLKTFIAFWVDGFGFGSATNQICCRNFGNSFGQAAYDMLKNSWNQNTII